MDPITIALVIAVAVVVSYAVSDPDRDATTKSHWHTFGQSGIAYAHTHWYANTHNHYTVATKRSNVRTDSYIGPATAADVASHGLDGNGTRIVA